MSIPKSKSCETFEIFGLYHQSCGPEANTALSNPSAAISFAVEQEDSGVFRPAGTGGVQATNICRKRYSFTPDSDVKLEDLTLSGADYFVCDGDSESNTDCIAANRRLSLLSMWQTFKCTCLKRAMISARKLGGLGSFVQHNTVAARVICAGACAQSTLYDLTLDWRDTFVASLDKDENTLSVTLDSYWGDDRTSSGGAGLNVQEASAYIGASDDCLLDGRLATPVHTVASKCRAVSATKDGDTVNDGNGTLFSAAEYHDVTDMLTLFQECGDHPEEDKNPFVYLNQQFKVTYADEDNGKSALYCNTKKLTLGVADMSGQITATMTVNAEVGDDFCAPLQWKTFK